MSEREAFIEAIAADPGDDTARLAFADWLQEHGEEDRAEFIRIACEIAARRRDEPWSGPFPDDLRGLWERAHDLFELRGSFWLEPFYRALGADERPAPSEPRWPGRVRRLWAGEPRHTSYHLGEFQGDTASMAGWGNGPAREIGVQRGLAEYVRLDFESPFPVSDLATAFRLEPVSRMSIFFAPNTAGWRGIDVPCLRRVRALALVVPPAVTRRAATAFEELAHGSNWSGVNELWLHCPMAGGRATPSGYVARLGRSPLMARLRSLHATLAPSDLPFLVRSTTAELKSLELWWCNLTAATGATLAAAPLRAGLESLHIPLGRADAAGVQALAAAPWPRLRSLVLSSGDLTDASVRALLPLAPQLTDLSLGGGAITDAGALALADALDATKLRDLWLSYNPLSAETVATLRGRFGERFHFRTEAEDRAAAY